MDNSFIKETALVACLNDNQSLKKKDNIEYFRDPAFVHNIFTDIFENYSNNQTVYPETIRPVIEKVEAIWEKQLLDHYVDIIKRYQQKNIQIVRVTDRGYPYKLVKILDPPFVLYLKGNAESLTRPAVAVVGTRDISPKGAEKVQEIVEFLVQLGYIIVSGLALGTDTYAHKAALELGGDTIAVLPGDIENVVPKENQELAERITKSGSLISEITSLAKMHRGRYIERNRITSALSDGVVVIETGESGGSVRQAEIAFRQKRPVYAMKPDELNTEAMAGYRRLISNGAVPVESAHDLLRYFGKIQQSPASRPTTLADFS